MSNEEAASARDMPTVVPLFPLSGALLLPRGQLPLNIFEPRYLALIDDALKGHRLIGMIQPDPQGESSEVPPLFKVGCAGRITQFAESGDGRYIVTLTGVARFVVVDEIAAVTPYRQVKADFAAFENDFSPRLGEEAVDRDGVLKALRDFADANQLQIDWDSIHDAPNEALVNALSLLEAADLKGRADVLVAITEIELARGKNAPNTLQ
jgi:Lon protease-like protein